MAGGRHNRRGGGGEHEEDAERWLLTYADMITLLMAFFIMMWSMSLADKTKFTQMIGSVRSALGMDVTGLYLPPLPGQPSTTGTPAILAHDIRGVFNEELADSAMGSSIHVLSAEDSVTIRLEANQVFFPPARAELSGPIRRVLKEIARILRQVPYQVRIEGHTCDLPLRGAQFASNWELSAQRAFNVLMYFIKEEKLPADRFAGIGYGATRSVAPNNNEVNRRKNRRVDIRLLDVTSPTRLEMTPPEQLPKAPAQASEEPTVIEAIRIVPPVDISGQPAASDKEGD